MISKITALNCSESHKPAYDSGTPANNFRRTSGNIVYREDVDIYSVMHLYVAGTFFNNGGIVLAEFCYASCKIRVGKFVLKEKSFNRLGSPQLL